MKAAIEHATEQMCATCREDKAMLECACTAIRAAQAEAIKEALEAAADRCMEHAGRLQLANEPAGGLALALMAPQIRALEDQLLGGTRGGTTGTAPGKG